MPPLRKKPSVSALEVKLWLIDSLGHPCGRILGSFPGSEQFAVHMLDLLQDAIEARRCNLRNTRDDWRGVVGIQVAKKFGVSYR